MATTDLFAALEPVVASVGLELVDCEMRSGIFQVTVDREGGVDLEGLTDANRVVSARLDEIDPFPGRYSLEVSSPGIERPLRTPAHFAKAVGATISVKTRPQVPGDRRRQGRLVSSDDEGFSLITEGGNGEPERLLYDEVDRVRTVFVWGGEERKPGGSGGNKSPVKSKIPAQPTKTDNRKQGANR